MGAKSVIFLAVCGADSAALQLGACGSANHEMINRRCKAAGRFVKR